MEPRARQSFWVLLTAIPCALFTTTPLSDRDWPWHLADFERMTRERLAPWDRALWQDRFSYASEGDFLPVHWIFEVALGLAHRAFGLLGVELVRVGLVVAIFSLLHRLLAKRGLGPIAASAVALTVAALTRGRLIERPHLVTLLGFVLLWDQLVAFREGKQRSLWGLVPLFALWANSHPGVVYGAIFVTGFTFMELLRLPRDRGRPLALWTLAGLLATLVTPYGPRLYPYLVGHIAMQKHHHIAELRPLDFSRPEDFTFAAAVVVATLIAIRGFRHGVKTDLTDSLGTLGFLALAGLAARETNLALVAVAVTIAPVVAATIKEAQGELIDKDRGLTVFAWTFALLLGFGMPAWALGAQLYEGDLGTGLRPASYPVAEADWILEHQPKGRLFNTNASGGYLIWRLDPVAHPEWQVFTDGRQPLFTRAVNMPFRAIEENFRPNILVYDPLTPPYDTIPLVQEKFQLVHFSDGGRVYLRRDGPDQELLRRFAYRHLWFTSVENPLAPETSPRRWRLAVAFDANDPGAAKRELASRALMEEPGGHWANVALAQVLFREGDHASAAKAARRALDVKWNAEAAEILRAVEGR